MNQLCKVCGEPAAGFHFGAFTCEGCKSFFGRTCNNVSGISECKNGGRCEINKKNRTACKQCRLRKCLSVGMSKSGSRYGRRSNWFKIHCLLTAQNGGGGGMNSPSEANNNNSSAANHNSPPMGVFPPSGLDKSPLSSTITSMSSLSDSSSEERDRNGKGEREKAPLSSSSAFKNGANNANGISPATFTSFAGGLSPESREQFLESLNQKLINPEFANLFRAASIAGLGGFIGPGPFPYPGVNKEDASEGQDLSRGGNTRSHRSLESPKSDSSEEETKPPINSLFSFPPGSPNEIKPDHLSMDYIMKMGYDPMRLWPAMLSAAPNNLHQFNPYRFMFPGSFPSTFSGFPPSVAAGIPGLSQHPLINGAIHPAAAKLFPGAARLPEGLANLPSANMFKPSPDAVKCENSPGRASISPASHHRDSPLCLSSKERVITPAGSPTSNLTLTPPISHHSSDEPSSCGPTSLVKVCNLTAQDMPIDLSAKSFNNNNYASEDDDENDNAQVQTKRFVRVNGAHSPQHQSESDEDH